MQYLSTTQVAEKWGISIRRIVVLAKQGRIDGAVQIGMRWMIPKDAPKPADGRTGAARANGRQPTPFFRYPDFAHRDAAGFDPPLSEQELRMKKTAEAFFACRFARADELLGDLPEKAPDRYHRIHALYEGCMIDLLLCNTGRFCDRYGRLRRELQGNFAHKTEMQEYLHELDATLGESDYYAKRFTVIPGYPYHESFLPHLASLCAVSLLTVGKNTAVTELKTHELNCILLERSGAYADLQAVHIYLGSAYAMINQPEQMAYHIKAALTLAEKYDLYYMPAIQYYYLRKLFKPVLAGFDPAFQRRLEQLSEDIHNRFLKFTDAVSVNSIYKLLTRDEYLLLYCAAQGYTHKETATLMGVSVGTVSKRYSGIYAALGVAGRTEAVEIYNKMVSSPVWGEDSGR